MAKKRPIALTVETHKNRPLTMAPLTFDEALTGLLNTRPQKAAEKKKPASKK